MNLRRLSLTALDALGLALLVAALVLPFCVAGCSQSATSADRPAFVCTAQSAGTSMLPTFSEWETVRLELCKFSDLRAGDTVIYWHDGMRMWVHHRLTHRDAIDGRWHTRGDNNAWPDPGRMTSDEFIGRTHKL